MWDVFIYDEPTLLYAASQQKSCNLRLVGPTVFQSGFGAALTKNSSLTGKISNALIAYGEHDILETLNNKWFSGKCLKREQRPTSHGFAAMTIADMSGVFLGVAVGMGVAFVMLLVEFLVEKYGFPLSRLWTNSPNWGRANPTFYSTSNPSPD